MFQEIINSFQLTKGALSLIGTFTHRNHSKKASGISPFFPARSLLPVRLSSEGVPAHATPSQTMRSPSLSLSLSNWIFLQLFVTVLCLNFGYFYSISMMVHYYYFCFHKNNFLMACLVAEKMGERKKGLLNFMIIVISGPLRNGTTNELSRT